MSYLESVKQILISDESTLKIIDGDRTFNSTSIKEAIDKYMAYLESKQISKDVQVAILPSRKAEWVFFMYALMFRGITPLVIDRTMNKSGLNVMLHDVDVVYADKEQQLESVNIVRIPELDSIDNDTMDKTQLEIIHPDNKTLFTAHTSGTTGIPKKVNYTNDNIAWAVSEYERIYKLKDNDTILFSLPFHYCYSVIPCCVAPMSLGKTIVICPEEDSAEAIANLIEKHEVNILVVNPVFYKSLSSLNLSRYDFSSLRICDSGGESIPIPVVRKMKEKTDVLITEGYGLTETTSLTHFLLPDSNAELRLGSVGQACRQVECRIVDEDYMDVEDGAIGELLIKGPMVASYDDHEQNESANVNGWFKTGDLFYEDKDHFFYLVSRKKDAMDLPTDLVNTASVNIPLLLSNEQIKDMSYKFLSASELQLFVVGEDNIDKSLLEDNILHSLPEALSSIVTVKFVSLLPRTATGKVLKKDL
ncbi:MAG TPA: AMP-binding protein [Candidatus Saccharibacteria bacterium]|jgi:long-chain acyl-CoA synthetase|nr:AMP-binding protein [Candidatus Saccharibacteria bacterium]